MRCLSLSLRADYFPVLFLLDPLPPSQIVNPFQFAVCVCFVACQAVFHTAILNDTLFLNIVNIVDYSIVVGLGEERRELVRLVWSSPSLYSLEGIYASTC